MTDAEGRTYLDLFGGILTTMTGHAMPEVVEAIREQAGKMLHSSTLYLIRPMVELAERIAGLSGIPDAKVFFTNSGLGGERGGAAARVVLPAVEPGDRAAQQLPRALVRDDRHHRQPRLVAVEPQPVQRAATCTTATGCAARSATSTTPASSTPALTISATSSRPRTAGDVACMIAEPIQGVGGFSIPPDGFFGAMKKVLDEHEILFISDEVQTGWGRTGEHFWGYQAHGVVPDALTFAKGLGNGLAIAGRRRPRRPHGFA